MTQHKDEARCADCDAAAKHAYSDATTPGFFSDKCSKHRAVASSPDRAEELAREIHETCCDVGPDGEIVMDISRAAALLRTHMGAER